jgi:hypothetical protein
MRRSFRLLRGQLGAAAQLKSYRFPQDSFQCIDVPMRCPHLQLRIARSAKPRQIFVWPGVEIHG